MDRATGDLNRRLAVLAILYYRRRMYPHNPEVTLTEIEERMGFPRDYLDFTIWYLTKKRYITKADNAELTLTVDGVDFIESQRTSIPLLEKLLTTGAKPDGTEQATPKPASEPSSTDHASDAERPIEVPADEIGSRR